LVERIWHNPHALLADGSSLQEKIRCRVTRLDHADGPFIWKHHNWGSFGRTVRRSLNRSVARKAWHDGHFLLAAGIPTPRPRAMLERRVGPLCTCSYVLTDYVPGTSLYRFMRFSQPAKEIVHYLAEQVAIIWQQLDELCVCHNDFKTENLLVDPQGKVWLIDLDRLRRFRHRGRMRRKQARDAADLFHPRNWRNRPAAAEVFRQSILRTTAAMEALAGPDAANHPLSRAVPAKNRAEQLLTVLIPCRNSAETILLCLESVRDMADEILVADAGSTDDTLRLVREFGGCRIIEGRFQDVVAFETWAYCQAKHAWILRLLPDEQLNPELARQVQDVLATEPEEDAFRIARTHFFHGQRLKCGGFHHDSTVRLFRKSAGSCELREGRVEVTVVSQRIGAFQPHLFYESCLSIERRLGEAIRIAADSAAETVDQYGLRPRLWNALWRAPWQLLKSYVFRGGFLDGWAGLHASYLSAFAIYLREAMLWEMQQPIAKRTSDAGQNWQETSVFDPYRTTDSALRAIAAPTPAATKETDRDADQKSVRKAA
jgi:hypothetical protein